MLFAHDFHSYFLCLLAVQSLFFFSGDSSGQFCPGKKRAQKKSPQEGGFFLIYFFAGFFFAAVVFLAAGFFAAVFFAVVFFAVVFFVKGIVSS
jgi:hypothetical protein